MGDEEATTEPEAENEAETSTPAEEPAAAPETPDLETRVGHLEAAILALGGADRIPTL